MGMGRGCIVGKGGGHGRMGMGRGCIVGKGGGDHGRMGIERGYNVRSPFDCICDVHFDGFLECNCLFLCMEFEVAFARS